jgi:photosystem II stability/assembly factor-like uncharacterized protein
MASPVASPLSAPPSTCHFRVMERQDSTPLDAIALLSPTIVFGIDNHCLYTSADGGLHFEKTRCAPFAEGADEPLQRLLFLSRARGFAITRGGDLLRTRDGGATFDLLPFPEHIVRDIHFADAVHGFWVGERLSGGTPDVLPAAFVTQDGGERWSEVPLLVPVEHRARLSGVWLRSPFEVWAVGDLLLTSRNGGRTWEQPPVEADVLSQLRNGAIRFSGAAVGVITRTPPENYLITCDGGQTFTTGRPPGPGLDALLHVDCQHAYAAAGGKIYRSEDQGQSFQEALSGEPDAPGFNIIEYLDSERLLFALSEHTVATCRVGPSPR